MIDDYLRTSLIFYDTKDKQDWRKPVLENIRIPKAQMTERYRLPPFNIRSTTLIGVPTVFKLYCKYTDVEKADLLSADYGGMDLLNFEWDGTYYWLVYDGETKLKKPMPTGEYYVKISDEIRTSDGIRTWDSEIINICECKENDYMGDFIFLANSTNGLEVYSVSDLGILNHINNDDQGGSALNIWVDKNFVYLANQARGIEVYSVSGNGTLTHLDNQGGTAIDVWGDGKFIYLANGLNGIEVYSVSDLGILTHIDNDDQGGTARGVWGDGKFIYLANDNRGIEVYSVSDSGILTHLDNELLGAFLAIDVWGDGKFIYLANEVNGIEVYSVSDLGILTHIDNDDQGGEAWGVWGDGNFVYLANFGRGIEVYSVSDAGILTHLNNDDIGGTAYHVCGDDNFVYLANAGRGIEVYSVSDAGILTHLDNDFIDVAHGVFANKDVNCTPMYSEITIEYENTHDFAGILSEYKGRVHLCADIRNPDHKIIKSGIERDGETWIQKIITQKIYRFNILCTESLIDTLTMIPSYETITVHFDNESAEVKEFSVAPPEWKYEGLGQLEISFIVETIIKTNCDEDYELQEELVLNGDFSVWAGDNPVDWIVTGEAGNDPEISEVAPNEGHGGTGLGACNIYSTNVSITMRPTIHILTIGKIYLIEIEITKIIDGDIAVRCGIADPWTVLSTEGIHKLIKTCAGDNIFLIKRNNVTCDVTIDNVSVKLYS